MFLSWTRRVDSLRGSRWKIYSEQIKNRIPIRWEEFKAQVLQYNPSLKSDGWCFVPDKEYILPEISETSEVKLQHVIRNVPYLSQLDIPHTGGLYWASDPDRKDETPDGCWMNDLPDGGFFGRGARHCSGPREKGCIRPGACNVTSLFMLLSYFNLTAAPVSYPDGSPISDWLRHHQLSPTWLYVYLMEFWGKGQQLWDGIHPASACNSLITARGYYLAALLRKFVRLNDHSLTVIYQPSVTQAEYCRAIDSGTPVILNSGQMHHVVLGIGYTLKFEELYMIAHDPYGRKNINMTRWKDYNRCGENDRKGQAVHYRFNKLAPKYMIYISRNSI